MAQILVGISGWVYPPWRNNFYPEGLPQKQELAFASRQVSAIEINGTFYSLKKPEHFQAWLDQAPPGFTFAVKGGRYVTHTLRAKNAKQALANFFASGILKLGKSLGPILWQFPPNLTLTDERFETFFDLLPKTWAEAVALATEHNEKVAGRAFTEQVTDGPIRHACEFRHESFLDTSFLALMRSHNIAAVIADAGQSSWPVFSDLTADFAYFRLHGLGPELEEGYPLDFLESFADRIQFVASGQMLDEAAALLPPTEILERDVYVFFDNDAKARAPKNAGELIQILESLNV